MINRKFAFWFSRTVLFSLFAIFFAQLAAAACKSVSSSSSSASSAGKTAAGPSGSMKPDLNDRCEHWYYVQNLLREQKWDDLEAMVDVDRATRARFPGGEWKLARAYKALAYPLQSDDTDPPTDDEWQAHGARLAAWVAARPNSITARIALARFYTEYAWATRGNEFADLVKENAMQLFDQRIQKARDVLDGANSLPAKCPEWYLQMMNVAQAQGWDLSEQDRLFRTATEFEPLYYYYYTAYATILLPQWYGEPGASERFADQIADRIGGKQGDFVYFEIALKLDGTDCNTCISYKPQPESMSWERIKKGYAAEVGLYGSSPYKLNRFAQLAFHAGDSYLAAALFLEIGNHRVDEVWSRRIFTATRQIALSMPDELIEKFQLTIANYQKPGGVAYMKQLTSDFHARLDSASKSCSDAAVRDDGTFAVFFRLGKKGEVEEAIAWPPTNVSNCLLPKVSAQSFSPPPEPDYWTYVNVGEVKPAVISFLGATIPDIGR